MAINLPPRMEQEAAGVKSHTAPLTFSEGESKLMMKGGGDGGKKIFGPLSMKMDTNEFASLAVGKMVPEDLPRDATTRAVMERMKNNWSTSSWAQRELQARRAAEELGCSHDEVLENPNFLVMAAVRVSEKMVSDPEVTYSYKTAQTNIRHAKGFANYLGMTKETGAFAKLYHAALNPRELVELDESAIPATKAQCVALIKTSTPPVSTAVFLMRKSASRWDETKKVRRSQILIMEEEELMLVSWLNTTKASRADPFHPRFLTVISWDSENSTKPTKEVLEFLRAMKPEQAIGDYLSDSQLSSVLSKVKADPKEKELMEMMNIVSKETLTFHSFKKSSLNELAAAAALGIIPNGLVPLLAKHSDPVATQVVPTTTARYVTNKLVLAKMHGTQKATTLL
jgi:hypothetical protein